MCSGWGAQWVQEERALHAVGCSEARQPASQRAPCGLLVASASASPGLPCLPSTNLVPPSQPCTADDGEAKYDLAFKSKDNDGSQKKSGAEMADFYQDLCSKYPIISIEVGAGRTGGKERGKKRK